VYAVSVPMIIAGSNHYFVVAWRGKRRITYRTDFKRA